MRNKKEKRENALLTFGAFVIFAILLTGFWYAFGNSGKTYAIATSPQFDGKRYKYVTEREVKVTYLGDDIYLDTSGHEWEFQNESLNPQKGKQYKMRIHDNGTQTEIEDDVVIATYK